MIPVGPTLLVAATLLLVTPFLPNWALRLGGGLLAAIPLILVWLRYRHERAASAASSASAWKTLEQGRLERERLILAQRDELQALDRSWKEKWDAARSETLQRVGQLTAVLGQLPPDLHDKTFSLEVLLQQLASVRNQIESSATSLAANFFEIHAAAKMQSRKTETVFAALTGDAGGEQENVLADTKTALESLVQHVREAGAVYRRNLAAVTRITEHTQGIESHIKSIEVIADRTNVLAINAGIEAARSGVHGKGFNVVAQEVRRLSGLTEGTAEEIQKILREMVALTKDVHAEFAGGVDAMSALADRAEGVFQASVVKINAIMENARKDLVVLKEDAASLARNTSQAVVSMQFHDIIRQRVEHVLEPLGEVRTQLVALGRELGPHLPGPAAHGFHTDKTAKWLSGYYTMKEEQDVLQSALATFEKTR